MIDPNESTDAELWEATMSDELEERAEAMNSLAIRLSGTAQDDQAEGLFQAALADYQGVESVLDTARISYTYASHLNRSRRYEEALALLETSIAGYSAELRWEWLTDSIRQRGISYRGLSKIDEAVSDFVRAVHDYSELGFHEAAARTQAELVDLLSGADRQADAARECERAIRLAEFSENPEFSVRAHDQLTRALTELGDYDRALGSAQTALALALHLDSDGGVARARVRVGEVLVLQRKFTEALTFLDVASAEYRAAGKLSRATESDLNRLRCLYGLGRLAEAEVLASELSAYATAIDAPRLRALTALVIGDARTTAGHTVAAAERYWFAHEQAEKYGDPFLSNLVTVTWAEAALLGGDYGKALELVAPLDASRWGHGRVMRARHLAVRATAQAHREPDPARAELYILECLALGPAVGLAYPHAHCYEQWAEIRRLQGRHAEATVLIGHAVGLYLRAGRADRVERLSSWLLPEGYLTREPTDAPLVDPSLLDIVDFSVSGVADNIVNKDKR
jgi:tetratricopeptide (TPR) repeat protein